MRNNEQRATAREVLFGLALGAVAGVSLYAGLSLLDSAQGATPNYCDEGGQSALTVTSEGSDWCRDHGWIIKRTIVIDPQGWVRATTLGRCANDEPVGGPCLWLADRQGNGEGQSFWLDRNQTVHPIAGVR